MNKTPIQWTNLSSNPFKARHKPDASYTAEEKCVRCGMSRKAIESLKPVNLCVKISPGCAHCYAATLTHRWGGPDYIKKSLECFEPVLVEKELEAILKCRPPNPGENLVFPFDMTDLFLEFWPDEFLDKFFAVVALRPDLILQILTKRAERMQQYCDWSDICSPKGPRDMPDRLAPYVRDVGGDPGNVFWPLSNVHFGVSCEDQETFKERWPFLRDTPAVVRWISFEPLLDSIKLPDLKGLLHWAVLGGESGPNARACSIEFAMRPLIQQLRKQRIAIFVKQLGAWPGISAAEAAGCKRKGSPGNWFLRLNDKKGGDWDEWSDDLRVREYPA